MPIYLTDRRGKLFGELEWDDDILTWVLFLFYLIFLVIITPLIDRKMTHTFKKGSFSFIHAIFLTIILALTDMISYKGVHLLSKLLIIWMVGLLPWVLQKNKK